MRSPLIALTAVGLLSSGCAVPRELHQVKTSVHVRASAEGKDHAVNVAIQKWVAAFVQREVDLAALPLTRHERLFEREDFPPSFEQELATLAKTTLRDERWVFGGGMLCRSGRYYFSGKVDALPVRQRVRKALVDQAAKLGAH